MAQDLKQEARDLLEKSGWIQAEAARQLGITPGAFSQIIRKNSPVKPSQGTLTLFRLLVEGKDGKPKETALEKWEAKLIQALRSVPLKRRRKLAGAFINIIQATK